MAPPVPSGYMEAPTLSLAHDTLIEKISTQQGTHSTFSTERTTLDRRTQHSTQPLLTTAKARLLNGQLVQ